MSKRKSNGEGSVFQVSPTKWVAKISLGTRPDGKPNIKQFSGKTEAVVKKKLRDFKKSVDFAEKHMPTKDTVQAYFSMWLNEYQFNKLKPASYDRLESTVVNYIYPHLGGIKMDKVTRDQIQALLNLLCKEKKLSHSSVKKVYVALNACYAHALVDDVVLKNPCIGVVLPSLAKNTKQISPLNEEDIERLKREISKKNNKGKPLYPYGQAFVLLLHTGLRMGEALSLRWSDVDFERKTITVTKNTILTKRRDENGNRLGGYQMQTQSSTKTSSGNRTVPINHSAQEALTALKEGNSTEYVIVNSRQHSVRPNNFERSFQTALKQAKIQGDYGVHSLRHTFASMLFAKGVDVKIVSRLLGHSTVKITYDIYVHLFEDTLHRVTNVLD